MKNLIIWLNRIINKHKALKRWKRVVTVMAAIMTFVTTYALILPAITVERNKTEEIGGMYLEQEASTDDMLEENALEPTGISIAADHEDAVSFSYADEEIGATAIFSTDEDIPEGAELVVYPVDQESEEYADLSSRSLGLLDKEFIYDVTTCSFYDFALVYDNVDVTPETGLVDIQINFLNNTVEHVEDTLFAGRFAKPASEEGGFVAMSADDRAIDIVEAADELISVNPDESSVIELTDDIITVFSLKGNDLAYSDSLVGILAGYVDEDLKAAVAETDAEIPEYDDSQDEYDLGNSAEDDAEEATPAVNFLRVFGSDYNVTLTYDETSGIPEGAALVVSEIDQNSKEYQTYLQETKKAMGLTEEETLPRFAARFFDIKIMVGDDEFIPESGVSVEITYAEPLAENPDTEVSAVHFADESAEAEVIEASTTEVQEDGSATVGFTAESFSVYGVIYTVDFHWEVDGKQYEVSLPGGGYVSFSKLMEILGVAEEAQADVQISDASKHFVADVEKVEFSAPELVWVGKVDEETTVGELKEAYGLEVQYSAELTEEEIEAINAQTVEAGDWALISVQPFTSEETLTVTMKGGEVFSIQVTDASYDASVVNVSNLDGAKGALVRTANPTSAVQSTAQNSNHLQAVAVTINSSTNQISASDDVQITEWTFEKVPNTSNQYYISADNGYLNIGYGSATVGTTRQALEVQMDNNQIRIKHTDNNYALNNDSNSVANGYSSWNGSGQGYHNPGEWFTIYKLTVPTLGDQLDGEDFAIINNRGGGSTWTALRDEIDDTKDSCGYYVSGNTTTRTIDNGVDYSSFGDIHWTFEYVKEDDTGSYYRIKTSKGYLFIDPDITAKSDMPPGQSHENEHALRLESSAGDGSASDGTLIRVVPNGDGTYLLQNRNGVCLWNYGSNQFWLSTLAEDGGSASDKANSRFRLAKRVDTPNVTVHYVDRAGRPLTGVVHTGSNADVLANGDGTFTIPFNTAADIDLRANFDFTNVSPDNTNYSEYTYANTHLAGTGDYSEMTHEGYLIDSKLTHSNNGLQFASDSGEGAFSTDPGNKDYRPLVGSGGMGFGAWNFNSYSLSGDVYNKPENHSSRIKYAESGNKDIYVILDPLPGESAATVSGGSTIDADDPELSKTMEPNEDDGTYTLSLKVDAHARNVQETNKANVLFVVDTSSSMHKKTKNGTRISDTYDAVKGFGDKLLLYNNDPTRTDAVEVAMITFDGKEVERLDWTTSKSEFDTTVDEYLRYYWLHTGTDWEDAMKGALDKLLHDTEDAHPTDSDPTFVVFFTDGEPSQYTNFNGVGNNSNADPITGNTEHDEITNSYQNWYSYFLSREGSKDEMRAIVDAGAQLYGIYAYNTTNEYYTSYNGNEDGAKMLHNAIRYAYNETGSLEDNLFYEAEETDDLIGAFDKIYNLITEQVGFSNVVVKDGIAADVTSSSVIGTEEVPGDPAGFTYIITDNKGNLDYRVTVAPNGVPEGQTVVDGKPIFTLKKSDGTGYQTVVGSIEPIPTTKIKVNDDGEPILDDDGNFQTEIVNVDAYYCEDDDGNKYIMPIATPGENIEWDLSPLGILKDGYSYEVNFIVWPNQEAYDLVADLNNGNPRNIQITEDWSSSNPDVKTYTDKNGRVYKKGGIKEYPYIARYEDNKVYSAMSNTDQSVDFYKFDKKIEEGEETTEITDGSTSTLPPDPMPLTASLSRIEKLWNYKRDPGLFAQYLYNTGGSSKGFAVDFDIFQEDDSDTPYTGESLGWVYDLDSQGHYIYLGENEPGDYVLEKDPVTGEETGRKIKGHYEWVTGDTMTNVTYAGYAHQIGTRWVSDFSIATGLILTSGEMDRLGMNKSLYPSTEFGEGAARETYYILEPGHDYTIKEHQEGTIGYEFDFFAPTYHPMLIDGKLKNVEIEYTYLTDDDGNYITDDEGNKKIATATINKITGSDAGLSGLEIENTLRGYINLNKVVVDEDHQHVESDNTKFEYVIRLDSPTNPGPFKGTHIPWYGVNGLYYNDGHENYYQVYEAQDHTWMIRNEAGREYALTSTGFDPDDAEEQTVTYEVDGEPKELKIYGNQMTATADGRTATATLAITQNETLYIANIPVGTSYSITEANADGYYLIDILKEVKDGTNVERSEHVPNSQLSDREATGTIVTNRDNHVTYTNQIRTGDLQITKRIHKNGTLDTSATGKFYYAVYDEPYNKDADPAQVPVRTGSIDVTAGGTKTVTEPDLKMGTYYVYELTGEGGTPVISGEGGIYVGETGTFNSGKYYAVTTTGSPTVVYENQTSSVGIVNNYRTTPVTASKTWADKNPQHLTIYFKLFYENAAGIAVTTGTPLEALTYDNMSSDGVISVTWNDLPMYDENGNEYDYIVREYVLDDTNGEFEEGEHKYMEAAPNGYVNTEAGLSVTNSKLETYEPVTTYSGLKVWVDTVNGGKTRPDGLTVTLMIDKDDPDEDVPVLGENGEPLKPDWVTVGDNQWRYTFTKLPMFDDEHNIIKYYVVETPVAGYDGTITSHSDTEYVYASSTLSHELNQEDHDAYPQMDSDADLVYAAVMKEYQVNNETYLYHIWTQRIPTPDEQRRLVELFNTDLTEQNLPANAEVGNVHWCNGLPINQEFIYKPQPQGYKISFTRYNTNTIRVKVDNPGAFQDIAYGTLKYNYTAGSTSFENTLQPITYTVEKTWGQGINPPEGAVIVAELHGTIQRAVEPQSDGATETQYTTVPIDITALSLNQKIQVTLNGGAEGGDDTTADPWKYTWSNLPAYDKAGNEITYSVRELSYTIGGHTVNLRDFAPGIDNGTAGKTILTNQIPEYSFDILKIDTDTAQTLPGAEFVIQAIQPTSTTASPVAIGEASPSDPASTGENGKVSFNNYSLGYYEVSEVKAPYGHVLTDEGKFYVRVDTDGVKLLEKVITDGELSFREVPAVNGRTILGNVEFTKSGNIFTFTVENPLGAALPNAGGHGTTLFYLVGLLLTGIAGAVLLLRRRRRTV